MALNGVFICHMPSRQPTQAGLSQAFLIEEKFLAGQSSALVLGDKLFCGQGLAGLPDSANRRAAGATVFAYQVSEPGQYGVISFSASGKAAAIEEKALLRSRNLL